MQAILRVGARAADQTVGAVTTASLEMYGAAPGTILTQGGLVWMSFPRSSSRE